MAEATACVTAIGNRWRKQLHVAKIKMTSISSQVKEFLCVVNEYEKLLTKLYFYLLFDYA
jgi:hypothetical protein